MPLRLCLVGRAGGADAGIVARTAALVLGLESAVTCGGRGGKLESCLHEILDRDSHLTLRQLEKHRPVLASFSKASSAIAQDMPRDETQVKKSTCLLVVESGEVKPKL